MYLAYALFKQSIHYSEAVTFIIRNSNVLGKYVFVTGKRFIVGAKHLKLTLGFFVRYSMKRIFKNNKRQ